MSRCTAEQKLLMKNGKIILLSFYFAQTVSIRFENLLAAYVQFFINGEGVSNHMAILHLLLVK